MRSELSIARQTARGDLSELHVNKFGWTPDCDTGSRQPVWDGGASPKTYTFLTTAVVLYIMSTNTGDKQTYQISGLGENWEMQTETVTANGQTPVVTTKKWIRVFRIKNTGVTSNAGSIYLSSSNANTTGTPTTASTIKAKITIGNNQTLMAIYTVPAGYTAFIGKWYASCGKGEDIEATLWVRPSGGVFQLKDHQMVYQVAMERCFCPHAYATEKSDIYVAAQAQTVGNSEVSAGFDLILEKAQEE